MQITHIVPGDSAAGSLRKALSFAGRNERLVVFRDDLSRGPIATLEPAARAAWWHEQIDWPAIEENLKSFWLDVEKAEKVVLWFERHSASELALLLAWAWHRGERPYDVIDVADLPLPVKSARDESVAFKPAQAISNVSYSHLANLFGSERRVSRDESLLLKQKWSNLMAENAPLRIVTANGLASVADDYFDSLILAQVTSDWRKIAMVVGRAMLSSCERYVQVGDMVLHDRVIALIERGTLIANGDYFQMRASEIRLPD